MHTCLNACLAACGSKGVVGCGGIFKIPVRNDIGGQGCLVEVAHRSLDLCIGEDAVPDGEVVDNAVDTATAVGIAADRYNLTVGDVVNVLFISGSRGAGTSCRTLPTRDGLLHAVYIEVAAESAGGVVVERIGEVYPVAYGDLCVTVGILELVVARCVRAAEGVATDRAVRGKVVPNPAPVGLRP